MKFIVILSVFMNLLVAAAFITGYFVVPKDMQYLVDYMQLPSSDKELLRKDALPVIKGAPEMTRESLQEIFEKESWEDVVKEFGTSSEKAIDEAKEVLSRVVAQIKRQQRDGSSALERNAIRAKEYVDYQERMDKDRENLKLRTQDFDKEVRAWADLKTLNALNQTVEAFDKADNKPEELLPSIQGRPVLHQIYILRKIKDKVKAETIRGLLPEEEQIAIRDRESNPIDVNQTLFGSSGVLDQNANTSSE